MKLTDFKVLTFDCYGTLIDWETGLYDSLRPLLGRLRTARSRNAVLEAFGRHELAQERETPEMIYSDLLAEVHRRLAREWGLTASETEHRRFGESVPDWPAFADSRPSLEYLRQHYQLVILSNVDRVSFAGSRVKLGVQFDAVITAQDVGSYKPDPRNFRYLIDHLAGRGIAREQILHTAESLLHDHAPANAHGLASAWIHRRYNQEGSGATVAPDHMPKFNFRFSSLEEMVKAHQRENLV